MKKNVVKIQHYLFFMQNNLFLRKIGSYFCIKIMFIINKKQKQTKEIYD